MLARHLNTHGWALALLLSVLTCLASQPSDAATSLNKNELNATASQEATITDALLPLGDEHPDKQSIFNRISDYTASLLSRDAQTMEASSDSSDGEATEATLLSNAETTDDEPPLKATPVKTQKVKAGKATSKKAETALDEPDKQTPGEKAKQEPTLKAETKLLDFYRLDNVDPIGEVVLRTSLNKDGTEASLLVNQQEVIRFRSTLNEESPKLRARLAAHRLYNHLLTGGSYETLRVQADDEQGLAMIEADGDAILAVDATTSQKAKHPTPYRLAQVWTTQLRQSLGEPKPDPATLEAVVAEALEDAEERQAKPSIFNAKPKKRLIGLASWYGPGFHGRTAADGSRYNMYAMTAAHKSLPFGTKVRVTNKANGKSCIVTITDRGPYVGPRIIDLSKAAAQSLNMLGSGVAQVTVDVVQWGTNRRFFR